MDAIDILGSILGRKSKSKSSGGQILKDIFGGGSKSQPAESRNNHQHERESRDFGDSLPRGSRREYRHDDAEDLEELLRVSRHHHTERRTQKRQTSGSTKNQTHNYPPVKVPQRDSQQFEAMNKQSEILVRAMVNAAKSDGQIDKTEQEHILGELDHVSQSELDFLRKEFQLPLEVRDFAWSVPLGMEQKVYSVSLMAIDLDLQKEAKYLADLAHGLRIEPETCNQIHRRFQAPEIFRS